VGLRTAHLISFGILLGGHVFEIDPARVVPFLVATIVTSRPSRFTSATPNGSV